MICCQRPPVCIYVTHLYQKTCLHSLPYDYPKGRRVPASQTSLFILMLHPPKAPTCSFPLFYRPFPFRANSCLPCLRSIQSIRPVVSPCSCAFSFRSNRPGPLPFHVPPSTDSGKAWLAHCLNKHESMKVCRSTRPQIGSPPRRLSSVDASACDLDMFTQHTKSSRPSFVYLSC